MAVKRRSTGHWQVDLKSRYVGVYADQGVAEMIEATGKHQLALGKPLQQVIDELRGRGARALPPTLDEHAERWLGTLTLSRETILRYRENYERVSPSLGALRIDLIGHEDVRRAVARLSRAYAPKTVAMSITALRSILTDAVDSGLIERSPAARITNAPKVRRVREPHVLTREEYAALVAAAPDRHRPLVALMPLVGLRPSEIGGLEREDFDGERLHVSRQYVKGRMRQLKTRRSDRFVELSPAAQGWMSAQLASHGFSCVFPNTEGHPLSYDLIRRVFAGLREDTSIDVRPYDCRHTFGSWLIRSGTDVQTVADMMGHTDASLTLRVYTHELAERNRKAVPRLDEWLFGEEAGTVD